MEQGMMVMPQTLDAACLLEVEYGIGNLTAQTKQFNIQPVLAAFVKSNQYSINIEFTATAITFVVAVEPFVTPINDVDIP